jgi:hypothetical protein
MISSFLLVGQSNMAGRGYLKDVRQIYDEQIKVLVNGRWQTMTEPMNFDRPTAGIGLAASFAGAWRLANDRAQIGLIPCADGGSSLDDWAVGGALFEHAVSQARFAQRVSVVSGILWHQGENDSFAGRSAAYYDKLTTIVNAFRAELDAWNIPFILGGLGDFLGGGRYGKYFTEYNEVNHALQKYALETPNAYFVTSAGLTANDDGLHFNAVSLRKFGVRYYQSFSERTSVLEPLNGEDNLVEMIQDRPLTKTEKIALLEISFAKGDISLRDYEERLTALKNG